MQQISPKVSGHRHTGYIEKVVDVGEEKEIARTAVQNKKKNIITNRNETEDLFCCRKPCT